jgi:hypothetical protein
VPEYSGLGSWVRFGDPDFISPIAVLRFLHAACSEESAAADKQGVRTDESLLGNSVKRKKEKIMLGRKTLKRLSIGMLAAAACAAMLPSTASAQEVTCVWYNHAYDFCTVKDWNPATMQYEITETYFKYKGTVATIDP